MRGFPYSFFLSLLVACVCGVQPAIGQTPVRYDLSPEFTAQDKRLQKKITLVAEDMSFSEILEDLAKQTGVALKIDREAPASGVNVLVRLKGIPLIEAMNTLWSSVSYKGSEWLWEASGKGDKTEYTLVKTNRSAELPKNLEHYVRLKFEQFVEGMFKFGQLTKDERKKNLDLYFDSSLVQRDTKIKFPPEGEFWDLYFDDLKLLGDIRTPAQIVEVMLGSPWKHQVDQLPKDQQEKIQKLMERHMPELKEKPMDSSFTFILKNDGLFDRNNPGLMPTLWVGLERNHEMNGFASIRGRQIEGGLANYIRSLWIAKPDDQERNLIEKRPLYPDTPPYPAIHDGPHGGIDWTNLRRKWWMKIGDQYDLPLCVLVSTLPGTDAFPYTPQRLEELLRGKDGRDMGNMPMIKWRDGILISAPTSWYRGAEGYAPAVVTDTLKRLEDKQRIPVLDLAQLIGVLDDMKWQGLTERQPILKSLNPLRPVLTDSLLRGDFARPNGIPLSEENLKVLPPYVAKAKEAGLTAARLTAARGRFNWGGTEKSGYALRVEVLTPSRRWIVAETYPLFVD